MSDLFVQYRNQGNLAEFARTVFGLLGITDIEEHESSNYPRGHYFVGRALGIRLNVYFADVAGFEEFDYWLTAQLDWWPADLYTELWSPDIKLHARDTILDIIARQMTVACFDVVRLLDWKTNEVMTYSRNR